MRSTKQAVILDGTPSHDHAESFPWGIVRMPIDLKSTCSTMDGFLELLAPHFLESYGSGLTEAYLEMQTRFGIQIVTNASLRQKKISGKPKSVIRSVGNVQRQYRNDVQP